MKHFKGIIPIILLASILYGCTNNTGESVDAPVQDNSLQSTSTVLLDRPENSASSAAAVSSAPVVSSVPSSSVPVASSVPSSSEPTVSDDQPQREPTESEQILKLLADYGKFIHRYMLPIDPKNWEDLPVIDRNVSISVYYRWDGTSETISIIDSDQSDVDYKVFCKVKDEWLDVLDSLATENQKQQLIQESPYFINYEGDIYLSRVGAGGDGLGMSYLVLDSIEYTDENTIACKVTSVGDKDEWGLESDWVESETVTIKRTDKGLRVDSCSEKMARILGFYRAIRHGDLTLSFWGAL